MRIDRMPTTIVLLAFPWLIAILGLIIGGYLIIFRFNEVNSLISGFSILLGSLLLAAVIRMFGNIGQMLFDVKGFLYALNEDLKTQLQSQTTTLTQGLQELNHSLSDDLQTLKNRFEQISCDSKDISQNIHQITTFFEQIERHLDLKK